MFGPSDVCSYVLTAPSAPPAIPTLLSCSATQVPAGCVADLGLLGSLGVTLWAPYSLVSEGREEKGAYVSLQLKRVVEA